MHVALLNPQGNFDPKDSYWTAHPDFGGQLVYVKELALAMGALGHRVDIVTRQIVDPQWPEFAAPTDAYPGHPNVRILRIPCGPATFLPKEELWPFLGTEFVPRLIDHYEQEGGLPNATCAHYGDGGLCAVLLEEKTGIPFSFTAHSLGAQKMDKLHVTRRDLGEIDARYHFTQRLLSERLAMNRSAVNVTSTSQERYSQYTHNAYRGAIDPTDDARFGVVPPGVAMGIFDRAAQYADEAGVHARIREALTRDLPAERRNLPCIVASSRLDPKKNHLGLLEAFAGSPALREQANIVIVTSSLTDPLTDYSKAGAGERGVLDTLMAVIERSHLRGMVSMLALRNQGELAAGYRFFAKLHSVFALTALYEPFGLAPLEAMAAGLPAVVTKFGGPSESLRSGDEDYGILVDPSDPQEVSAGLFTLVSNAERWQRFAAAGYDRVLAQYTWTRTAEGYMEALAGHNRPVDETEREVRASSGTTAHPAVTAVALTGGAHPSASGARLPVPAYFIDPAANGAIPLQILDELYLGLDVLSVGETLVDFISYETVRSLRTAKQFTRYLGGQPANVAVYVAKLGGRAAVLSMVGSDYFAEFVEEQLQRHGVSTEAVHRCENLPTTNVFVSQTVSVPDSQVNRGADTMLDIRDVPEELIQRARAVHTSVFALSQEPQRSAVRRALRLAARHKKVVSLDPNYTARIWPDKEEAWEVMAEVMPYVTIVKPSLEDARRLFDPNLGDDALEAACLREFHDLGAKVVIVTRSGGTVTVSDGHSVEHIGPLPLHPVKNVVGGRDAFWSALLMAHLEGKPWPLCVRFAHEVAALKLRVVGHVERMIDREEIYRRLEQRG
ncbi:MAG TPA: PfkB family carbohydrate kinase [Chloroflexia bacterium]|nr:PfkB family carbohydrate kinase [Chloroflexia bacterium]